MSQETDKQEITSVDSEIVGPEEGPKTQLPTVPHDEHSIVPLIHEALSNPEISLEKLEKLMDLRDREESRVAKKCYFAALATFQGMAPVIAKTRAIPKKGGGVSHHYAGYGDIMRQIQPALAAAELGVRMSFDNSEPGVVTVICTVTHSAGHEEESPFTMPVDAKMYCNDSQKVGSANSYAKRYALINALNIATIDDEDDDGTSAGADTGPERLSPAAVKAIREAMAETDTQEEAACGYYNVTKVEDLQPAQSTELLLQLNKKRRNIEKAKRKRDDAEVPDAIRPMLRGGWKDTPNVPQSLPSCIEELALAHEEKMHPAIHGKAIDQMRELVAKSETWSEKLLIEQSAADLEVFPGEAYGNYDVIMKAIELLTK